jgi:beta-lactamase regulating signal transducer with metallopeptidase domain
MNIFEFFDSWPVAEALGWTLVHFLWQGALLAGLTWMVLHAMRHRSADARYAICCGAMAVMAAAPVITLFTILDTDTRPVAESAMALFILNLDRLPIWERLTPFLPWLTFFWLCGTFLLQGRIALNWTGVQRMKNRGTRAAPAALQQTADALSKQLGIRKSVHLLESSLARAPMVLGWFKPMILVPGYALSGLTEMQMKAVLAHELAHVRRCDYLVNLFQALFEALLFYHPAVWWLSSRLRAEREYCCDDVAVSICRDAVCYARALSSLDELRGVAYQTALAMTGGSLMDRIFRIVGVHSDNSYRLGGWLAPLIIVLSLGAAVSAVSLGSEATTDTVTNLIQEETGKPDDPDREKEFALQQKAEQIAKKMKEAGASDDEIKKAVLAFYEKANMKRVKTKKKEGEADLEAEYEMKKKAVIKKMDEAGKSKKEIKAALKELELDFKKVQQKRAQEAMLQKKEQELIEKMKAAGKSKKEIEIALQEFYKTPPEKIIHDGDAEFDDQVKKVVEKMKAEGKSKEEIKKTVSEMQMKRQKKLTKKKE